MKSILEEFFYGNISPEVQLFERDSAYGEALRLISRNEEKLLVRLNEEEKELLGKYIDAQMELNRLTAIKSQIYGYKLGVLMTAEAFVMWEDLLVS